MENNTGLAHRLRAAIADLREKRETCHPTDAENEAATAAYRLTAAALEIEFADVLRRIGDRE